MNRRFIESKLEYRSTNGQAYFEGYGAVFNSPSQNMGGYVEQVNPGAFSKTIQEADIRSLFNHDKNFVLGRTSAGTLKLSEDDTGLYYQVLAGNRSYERDLIESIERGDVYGSSFGFKVVGPNGESWGYNDNGFPQRSLNEVALYDVSPVLNPAYEATSTEWTQRSVNALCELRGIDPEGLQELEIPQAVEMLLANTIDLGESRSEEEEGEATDGADEERSTAPLSVYKAKLALKERQRSR